MPRTNGITVAALFCSVALSATAMSAAEKNTPKRPTVVYSIGIKGMTCETCSAHAQKGLAAVPDVIKASSGLQGGPRMGDGRAAARDCTEQDTASKCRG